MRAEVINMTVIQTVSRVSVLCILLIACTTEPDFHDTEGRIVDLNNFQGKFLLINYWAIWCKPCAEEIPELNTLAIEHGDRLSVLGVSFDALTPAELKSQAQQLGIGYPVLTVDPAEYLKISAPEVLPASYLIDADHNLVKVLVGPQTVDTIMQVVEAN